MQINPRFHFDTQFFSTPLDLFGISVRRDEGAVVINFISLAAADLKIPGETICRRSERKWQCFKRGDVMAASLWIETVTGTRERHLCQQQRRTIRRGKPSVGRDCGGCSVLKLYFDCGAQVV